jgi:hypothetical protein
MDFAWGTQQWPERFNTRDAESGLRVISKIEKFSAYLL